jgi:beta-galactosidase
VGGFGTDRTPGAVARTLWDTDEIWLRRSFRLDSTEFESLHLLIHHDEDAIVYLNGQRIAALEGYSVDYTFVPLTEEALRALRVGTNTLAVHVTQTDGGQYIDLGLADLIGMNR